MSPHSLVLGTRASALARWQADHVAAALRTAGFTVEVRLISTTGDRRMDDSFAWIGEKGLFTKELDDALLRREIDLAVHSLKDLPSTLPDGLALVAVPPRSSPFDALVLRTGMGQITMNGLPEGARIGTSSVRRRAQLLAWRADLQLEPMRGNVDSRLRKLDDSDLHAVILAEAGLRRLGRADRVSEVVSADIMIPAVGQGALGVVCAADREELRLAIRTALHDEKAGIEVRAERAFLGRLQGGCSVPVGALANLVGDEIRIDGVVASIDGRRTIRRSGAGLISEPEATGRALADALLDAGAGEILSRVGDDANG